MHPVAFSPDNKTLAIVSGSKTKEGEVRLIDTSSNVMAERTLDVEAPIACLAFSADGQTLACGIARSPQGPGSVQLWDLKTDKATTGPLMGKHLHSVVQLRFTSDEKRIVSRRSYSTKVFLFELATEKVETSEGLAGKEVSSFAVSQHGTVAVASRADNRVLLWNSQANVKRSFLNLEAPKGIREVHFTPEGRHLITLNNDGTVYVLRLPTSADKSAQPAAPDGKKAKLVLPSKSVEMTIIQRQEIAIPGSEGTVVARLGDITKGQVLLEVLTMAGQHLLNASVRQGDNVYFELGKQKYALRVQEVRNRLVGDDYVKVTITEEPPR